MRKQLSLLALLFAGTFLYAQSPSKITIKGVVTDTTGELIVLPTVMLLNPSDSTLVNFTRGDDKGAFQFKNVKNTAYLLKISYVGYLPLQVRVEPSINAIHDLGDLKIKPITTELLEVVVKAAKATLSIRGDTIEYDASSFKVPPGSTVEDLLRRLPGIEVDVDGNIKAQGKDVKRVYVDGKTFFGDDPKAATKNLGAETLSKVQVYNEKSEQAKLTGVDDGKKEKAMNLELKEEFKKGSFGKITGAGGTEDRWASRGNYNRFNQKDQLSFIGYANNINQTGVNWEDYGEFKGQSTFSEFDNGDFGFSNGGGRYFIFGGEDSPLNNFDGRGFTKNHGGGANYNFDNKKAKFNVSYFYNQTALNLDQFTDRQTLVNEGVSFFNSDTTNRFEFRRNHSINTRFEKDLDSNNILIVKAQARFGHSDSDNRQSQFFSDTDKTPTNRLSTDNGNLLDSRRLTSAAIFRHRFKKKGRSFAVSAGYNSSNSDGADDLYSLNYFFANDSSAQIRQMNANENTAWQLKSSLLYTEPLAKKWYWETFYNFSNSNNKVDRQVTDPESNGQRIDSLSIFYDNDILYNRVGSSIRYSNEGLNVSAGLAAQQLKLSGEYAREPGAPLLTPRIERIFTNLTPNVDFNYEFVNNMDIGFSYDYSVREPQLSDLQPVPNVNNPLFRTEGNPNLGPERSHSLGINLGYWNPAALSNFNIGMDYDIFDSQIVYNQTIEIIENGDARSTLTTTRPDNVSGGRRFSTYIWSSFPIVKTKLTMNLNPSVNIGNTPAFVNGVENETKNTGYNMRAGFNFTPDPKLIVGLNGYLSYNNVTYSIEERQNQKIRNHGTDASVKWQFAGKFFLESNFNYSVYRNDRFDFDRDIPIWNASLRRLFGKNNRIEVRLAAFDLLDRRLSITQRGTQNYVVSNIAPTLARYFMLSATYNMRGYENKLGRGGWW